MNLNKKMVGYNPNFVASDGGYFNPHKPFLENLELIAKENNSFRKVIYTGVHSQIVVMNLLASEILETEIHNNDQHFTYVSGAFAIHTYDPDEVLILESEGEIVIPANIKHKVVPGMHGAKFITRYSPPNHPWDRIQERKPRNEDEY